MDTPPNALKPDQESQKDAWKNKLYIANKIDLAVNAFINVITNNHGIKERNLLRLLLPIGVEVDNLDPIWLADMNSYGERRGLIAHNSRAKYRARQPIDPKDEFKAIKSLIRHGLRILDDILEEILCSLN
jgi:hypothetical protein